MTGKQKMSLQEPKRSRNLKKNKPSNPLNSESGDRGKGIGNRESMDTNSEALIASLESQIASLKEGIGDRAELSGRTGTPGSKAAGGIGKKGKKKGSPLSPIPYSLTPRPSLSPPAPLETPMLENVTPVGSRFLRVSWKPVNDANAYMIQWSTNGSFLNGTGSVKAASSDVSATVSGLAANTQYYVRVKALSNTGSYDSDFSPAMIVMSGISSNDETVTFLHNMLGELQTVYENFAVLVPQLETTELNSTDRRRLNGSGVHRYGFIEKVFEVSGDFPQFWPPFGEGREEMEQYVNEIDVLRNLLVWFRFGSRVVQDLLLLAGDNAFRVAGAYYTFAREGARQKNPEAAQVFEMLRLFWRRPRRTNGEPTMLEVERDTRAWLRGTKDGTISVSNESDSVIKGERVIIDNTQRKPRGGVKIVEEV